MTGARLKETDLQSLLTSLEDRTTKLGELVSSLWKKLSLSDSNMFIVGATLTALLQDKLLPLRTQRLVGIYLLFNLAQQKEGGAFGIVLKEIVDHGKDWEAVFVGKLTKKGVAGSMEGASAVLRDINEKNENEKADAKRWARQFAENKEKGKLQAISGVILDEEEAVEKGGLFEELGSEVELVDFAPEFPRIPPPIMDIDDDELMWVEPEVLHEVVWDPMMGQIPTRGVELKELVSKALKKPLQKTQQERVFSLLESDHKVVYYCGITPAKLPGLVENNPEVAKEVLLRLINSNKISSYFTALANMELSPKSMEFVNQLTNTVQLPPEFLRMFITNCIQSCENINDKYRQNRLVRLVCVFLQALIKNKIVDVHDLFFEVRAFCLGFGRIREAVTLFGVLQNMDKP